ncbi:MAG: hypothetical protein ABWX90_02390 [Candidatus Saccharimonadales bacterium]
MEFDFRARSVDTIKPIYHFPGDELVDEETYEQCMTGGYMSTISFGVGAAKSLGLQIDAETLERWKRICSAAYLIDDFVDNAHDTKTACDLYDESMRQVFEMTNEQILNKANLPNGASELLPPAILLMKNSVMALSQAQVQQLQESAMGINNITREKLGCDDMMAYITLLKQEAHYTSALISESVSENVYRQPTYPQYELWCRQLMIMAILGDSTIDMRDDSRHDIMKIQPSIANLGKLALHAYGAGRKIIKSKPQRRATYASLIERAKF